MIHLVRLQTSGWTAIVAAGLSVFPARWECTRGGSYDLAWRQTDVTLALLNRGKIVWRFNYGAKETKPCFHPLNTIEGTTLTWYRPPDHPWHRALWFSWKYINGLNYWEEDPGTGRSEGVTEVIQAKTYRNADFSARIELLLRYHPPGMPPILSEKRVLTVTPPSKKDGGRYWIDWRSRFTAGNRDVLLDRTPIQGEPDGKSWGGYAGLSVRLSSELKGWSALDSASRKDLQANRQHARWLDLGARTAGGQYAGITLFDHPQNPRHPVSWYLIMRSDTPFTYFSPALLYYRPYRLKAGKELDLRYRITLHSDRTEPGALEDEWKAFARTGTPPK